MVKVTIIRQRCGLVDKLSNAMEDWFSKRDEEIKKQGSGASLKIYWQKALVHRYEIYWFIEWEIK